MGGCLEGVARLIGAVLVFILALGLLASCAPAHIFGDRFLLRLTELTNWWNIWLTSIANRSRSESPQWETDSERS
jgi:hypothetical protein